MPALSQFVVYSPICVKCRGNCCKSYPGMCWPEDIKPFTVKRIVQMVRDEQYAVDWYEGDPRTHGALGRVLFVRPAVRGTSDALDPSWGGVCTFLTETGCSLTPDLRPRQCLALVPATTGDCKAPYSGKKSGAFAWRPYQNTMRGVVDKL